MNIIKCQGNIVEHLSQCILVYSSEQEAIVSGHMQQQQQVVLYMYHISCPYD